MKITVIGAGSWGTALALHFAQHNNEVALWTRNPDQIRTLQADRENKRGLPGFPFPESLTVHADLGEALKDSQLALIVTSVAGLRSSAELLKQHNAADIPVLAACKGFEQDTGLLTFQVLKEVLPNNKKNRRSLRPELCPRTGRPTALRRRSCFRKQRLGGRNHRPTEHQCNAPVRQYRRHRCCSGRCR